MMKTTLTKASISVICLLLSLVLASCGSTNTKDVTARDNTNDITNNNSNSSIAQSEGLADVSTSETDKSKTDTEASVTDITEPTKEPEVKLTAFEKLFADGPKLAWDDNKLAGYIDITGNWVINPQFPDALKFSEGLAAVKDSKTDLWGYIDVSGKFVIQPKFTDVTPFFEGTAITTGEGGRYGNAWGVIDKDGEYVIQPKYRMSTFFKEGYAIVSSDLKTYQFIDTNGNIAFNGESFLKAYLFHEGVAVVKGTDGRWKMLHSDGSFSNFGVDIDSGGFSSAILYGYWTASEYIPLSEGWEAKTSYGYYTMLDKDGKQTGKPFDYRFNFNGDYAFVDMGGSKKGFINKDYEWVVEPKYWEGGFIREGLAWVVENKSLGDYKWYIIDMQDNVICDFEDHKGIHFNSGQLYSIYPDKPEIPVPAIKKFSDDPLDFKCGYANWNYDEVIPFIYDEANGFAYDGSYAIVKYKGHYGIIDVKGNWLIEAKFTSFSSKPII